MQWDELWCNGALIIDFEPANVSFNDEFIIKDVISGELISYTALPGDGVQDVVLGLLAAFNIAYNTGDGKPWVYYEVKAIDKNNDSIFDTIRFRQIIGGNFGIELQPFTVDNGLPGNNPTLSKAYASGTNLLSWEYIRAR